MIWPCYCLTGRHPGESARGSRVIRRGRKLIIRVLQGRVRPGQIAHFREQAQQALDDVRQHDGLIHAQVGRQAHADGSEEIAFVSVWRDLEAVYHWLGGTDLLNTPMMSGADPEVLERFEVQHYEAYETAGAGLPEEGEPLQGATLNAGA
jgi:heme-degrading monooxygenase HmoA